MKRSLRIFLLIFSLMFFISGCSLIQIIKPNNPIDDIKPPINDDEVNINYVEYLNGIKSEKLGNVQIKYPTSKKGSNNLINVQAFEAYRFNFIAINGKIISKENIYNFTSDEDYVFEIHYSLKDEAKIILMDDDDTYLASEIKPLGSELFFRETLVLLPKLNIPVGSEFSNWDIDIPSVINKDLFIKANYQMEGYPYDAKIELLNDVVKIDNYLSYKASLEFSSELIVIEKGMIFLETNYFIEDLTLNNEEATIIKDNSNNLDFFSLKYDYSKKDSLNVRAYMIIQGLSGRQEVIYSDNIITPYVFADNLFFSYYIKGSSNNKAIAVFNGTGRSINLDEYKLLLYSNRNTTPRTLNLSGVLPHGESFIIIHTGFALGSIKEKNENGDILGMAWGNLDHTGNDSYELLHNNVVLDRIGTIGVDSNFGVDVSYQRSLNISQGNVTNWDSNNRFSFDNDEWINIGFNKFDNINSHKMEHMGYGPNYNINVYNQSIDELSFFTKGLIQDGISGHVNLLIESYNNPNVKFRWRSLNNDIFTNEGKYLRPESDSLINLEVEMIFNGEPLGVIETLEVLVSKYVEPVEILEVTFNEGIPQQWETNASTPGILDKVDTFLKSPEFSIYRAATLSFKTSSSSGKVKVVGLNQQNEEIYQFSILMNDQKEEYKITFLDTSLAFIKFEYQEGLIILEEVMLIEGLKNGENDFTPPVIFFDLPSRISRGSEINIDNCYAIDDFDGRLDCRIVYNELNTSIVGIYKLIIEASDKTGNIRTLEIFIEVYAFSSYMALDVDPSEVIVKFIDLGKYYTSDSEQGESTYIKIGEIDILIDAGMPYANTHKAMKEVLDQNVTGKLDYIIATHPHQDHIGGFPYIFENYAVGMAIIYSTNKKTNATMSNFLNALNNEPDLEYCEIIDNIKGNPNKDYCQSEYHLAPNVSIKFYDTGFLDSSDDNASSIVLTLHAFETTILLNGDAESKQEANYAPKLGKVDIFKMGHHGSRNGTSDLLLNSIDPDIAIISNGTIFGNKHGHPTFEAINRVYKYNSKIKIYVTTGGGSTADNCRIDGASYKCDIVNPKYDRNGTITLSVNSNNYFLTSENYANNILEFSKTSFWKNHPSRQYMHA